MERHRYPGTTDDRLKSFMYRVTGLGSDDRKNAENYAKRLLTFSKMKDGSKKVKYKQEVIEPFYEMVEENKALGDVITDITQIIFPDVDLG